MVKVGKWIAKHRILMLIIGFLLIIPSVIGMAATKVNYDLLSYLPEHLETVKGQDILVDEYGMGAFSMVVVENMEMKDVQKLEEKFEQVNHVKEVLWYADGCHAAEHTDCFCIGWSYQSSRIFKQLSTVGMSCQNSAITRKSQTNSLIKTIHGISRKHT